MNSVGIVVINYKGIEDTLECIESLKKQTYTNHTIIVVENGSDDGSAEKLKQIEKQYVDNLVVLYNDQNLGFDGGANTGIRWAIENGFDYVALLNNDATADKNWLKNLVEASKHRESGITTSLLLMADGQYIDSSGDWYSKWGIGFPRNRGDKRGQAPKGGFVFGASGGASLFSIPMLREIGLFDEDFFAYFEDNDISFRAQLSGWKVYYEPTAIAYHKLSQTSKRMPSGFATYHTFKNWPLVFTKNVPFRLLLPIGIRFFVAYWLLVGNAIIRGRGIPVLKGVFMATILSIKKLPERWHIQRNKKVSIEYIRSILWDDLPPDQTGLRKFRKIFIGK